MHLNFTGLSRVTFCVLFAFQCNSVDLGLKWKIAMWGLEVVWLHFKSLSGSGKFLMQKGNHGWCWAREEWNKFFSWNNEKSFWKRELLQWRFFFNLSINIWVIVIDGFFFVGAFPKMISWRIMGWWRICTYLLIRKFSIIFCSSFPSHNNDVISKQFHSWPAKSFKQRFQS